MIINLINCIYKNRIMKTKTLSFELSKRLNDLWLLDDIETEYIFQEWVIKTLWKWWALTKEWDWIIIIKKYLEKYEWLIFYKTLTLEEAIEFLPSFNLEKINFKDEEWNVVLRSYNIILWDFETWKMKKLIFAIEKYFEYLLDNNLLTK